mgnify:CR=1 FL=1
MKHATLFASALLSCAITLFGCQSVPENISEDLDARQLIQLGQDNFDTHHYKAAKKYFNTVLERFGDDPKHYIEAKYELGHLFLKQKNYRSAYDNFTEILEIYNSVPMGLPGSYKILCGIELAKIPEDKIAEFEAKEKADKEAEMKARAEARRKQEQLEAEMRQRRIEEEARRESQNQAAQRQEAQSDGEAEQESSKIENEIGQDAAGEKEQAPEAQSE